MTTRLLGFSKPTANSIDSVSDRDFVVEFIFVFIVNWHTLISSCRRNNFVDKSTF